jgi:hypothetical protein
MLARSSRRWSSRLKANFPPPSLGVGCGGSGKPLPEPPLFQPRCAIALAIWAAQGARSSQGAAAQRPLRIPLQHLLHAVGCYRGFNCRLRFLTGPGWDPLAQQYFCGPQLGPGEANLRRKTYQRMRSQIQTLEAKAKTRRFRKSLPTRLFAYHIG